jgi:hypothetical protein
MHLLAAMLVALALAPATEPDRPAPPAEAPDAGSVVGVIRHSTTGEPLIGALVVATCTCLPAEQARLTDDRGHYSFEDLPGGGYTLQVLLGKTEVTKRVELPQAARYRANFTLDPDRTPEIVVVIRARPVSCCRWRALERRIRRQARR